jgi:hypothetical protein
MASAIAGTSKAAFWHPMAMNRESRRDHDSPREADTLNQKRRIALL